MIEAVSLAGKLPHGAVRFGVWVFFVFCFALCGSLPADDRAMIEAVSLAGKLPHGAVRFGVWVFLVFVLLYVGVCLQTMGR